VTSLSSPAWSFVYDHAGRLVHKGPGALEEYGYL
jgi:hypothetical protein